jgi:hypothetical protein
MVFSGLLAERGNNRSPAVKKKKSNLTSPSLVSLASTSTVEAKESNAPEYISDESQLRTADPEEPDLRELNNSLEALATIFPDVQLDVFREMLSSFDGESRLALVADALLKNRVTWVKGRWRLAGNTPEKRPAIAYGSSSSSSEESLVPDNEAFKSNEYKKAVRTLAWHEFKGLSRSTINAVLAESNYCYLDARRVLVELSSKSWRFTISSIFLRRKAVSSAEAEKHPLVLWKSIDAGPKMPCLKPTGSSELDRELFSTLIAPLKERAKLAQLERDRSVAMSLNKAEAEEVGGTYDCACCFTTVTFEEVATCNADAHIICFRCVQHSITEAVFGQGWRRNIDMATGTLCCPAVDTSECGGRIPSDLIQRAMLEDKRGAEILHKFDKRLSEHSLVSSDLPLVRCPFCSYAEIDDIYLPTNESHLRLRVNNLYAIIFLALCVGSTPVLLPTLLFASLFALLIGSPHIFGEYVGRHFSSAILRFRRRRRGLKFACQDPDCGRTSCLSCCKEWVDVHVCHESSLVALRTQVEQAMSMAIKRVCPRCNTSFVKTAGCNKLTCPCGYKMCYVCRKDIGGTGDPTGNGGNRDGGADVGYRHFCDHFRPEGDPKPCTECKKCNLWESENTELVLKQAKDEAERKWRELENRDLSEAERAFLETGVAVKAGEKSVKMAFFRRRWPSVPEIFDIFVENVFV